MIILINPDKIEFKQRGYGCPDCNWRPSDIDLICNGYYYKVFNLLVCVIILVDSNEGKSPGPEWYPRYHSHSYGYEGNENWEETHYCPYCFKEFEISNGT